jgi:DNA-binding HxlR family transcriptional regulator
MMSLLGGKWKLIILWCIRNGVTRFGALQRAIPTITKKMLTSELRALESDGFLTRTVFAQVPPRVEYAMTPLALSLEDSLKVLAAWGEAHAVPRVRERVGAAT